MYAQLAVDSLLRLYKLDSNYVTFHMGFSRQLTMESLAKTTFEDTKNFNTERRGSFGEVRLDIHIIYFFCAYFLLLTISNMDTQHALSQLKTVDQTWFEFIEIASIIVAWYMTSSLTNNLNKSILSENVSLSLSICAETVGISFSFNRHVFPVWVHLLLLLHDVLLLATFLQDAEHWIWIPPYRSSVVHFPDCGTFADAVEPAACTSLFYTHRQGTTSRNKCSFPLGMFSHICDYLITVLPLQ